MSRSPTGDGAAALIASRLDELTARAKTVSARAYAPYSRFAVGAAALAADGRIFEGCNVENASYGLTMCAERSALFRAVAEGSVDIIAVAVYTPTSTPTAPCGACRQTLFEFGADAEIICVCDGPDVIRASASSLLPLAFGPSHLHREAGAGAGSGPEANV